MTRHGLVLVALLTLLTTSLAASADIYQWRDAQGKLHFSDKKPEDKSSTVVNSTQVNSFTTVSYELPPIEPSAPRAQPLLMYSTQRCGYCKQARAYLKKNGIAYSELDIDASESARAAYEKLGGGGVPLFVMGNARKHGFSEENFKRFYAAQTGLTPASR